MRKRNVEEEEILKEILKDCSFYEKIIIRVNRKIFIKINHRIRINLINILLN